MNLNPQIKIIIPTTKPKNQKTDPESKLSESTKQLVTTTAPLLFDRLSSSRLPLKDANTTVWVPEKWYTCTSINAGFEAA